MNIAPHLLPILSDPSQRKIVRAGRRVGKTDIIVREVILAICIIPEFRALVVTPTRAEAELLYDRIIENIDRRLIVRSVRHPYLAIEMHDGSRCSFLYGDRRGIGLGMTINGIWVDELDGLSDDLWDGCLAIAASSENPYIYLCGTTSGGARSRFRRNWPELGFSEHHLPSSVSPQWTPETEAWLRTQYSEEVFRQEFLAEL